MAYYNWFKKFVNILINIFFVFAIIATLFVFTSSFTGLTRIILFIVILIIYLLFIYFLKDKIKVLLDKLLHKIDKLDIKKMFIIISLTMILIKIIYYLLFNFDATQNGDILIYNQIADQIIKTRSIHTDAISHLLGVALHFTVFKLLNIPIHVGMFIVIFVGTIINFFSFKDIIGKNKAFLAVMLYILMPSTSLLSFCPTHEILLYMYLSISVFLINKFIKEDRNIKYLYSLLIVINTVLACLVNPSGNIILIIMALLILLSKIKNIKKIILAVLVVLCLLGSTVTSKALDINEHTTTMNTYTILIHGSNPESLGEQVDGYPLKEMRMYIHEFTEDFSDEGFEEAGKTVLFNQYKYLITHPLTLFSLIANKIYILWSGNHYSIELAHTYNAFNNITFYVLLAISTMIYLFVLTIGFVYYKKKEDEVFITNYKLVLLGCFGITMLCIVTNKYSLYVTLFIYLISFYRIYIDEQKY